MTQIRENIPDSGSGTFGLAKSDLTRNYQHTNFNLTLYSLQSRSSFTNWSLDNLNILSAPCHEVSVQRAAVPLCELRDNISNYGINQISICDKLYKYNILN